MFVRPLFLKNDISTWPQLQAYNTNNKYSIHCEYRFQVPLSNFWEREREMFSHTINREELQPGDHIYSWRKGVYPHHGECLTFRARSVMHPMFGFLDISISTPLRKEVESQHLIIIRGSHTHHTHTKTLRESEHCRKWKRLNVTSVLSVVLGAKIYWRFMRKQNDNESKSPCNEESSSFLLTIFYSREIEREVHFYEPLSLS